ncbi:MAG TPA: hypothetical protein VNC61_15555 [Acidimicrobiales bacterium]|nr:hypothetical protein [Acidimicrobiales bacterium]
MWDERVPIHVAGDLSDVDGFRSGRRRLAVEPFEVDELGEVDGYTGKGALIWLPDTPRWADVCTALVAPGGIFYLSEFHPVADMFGWESLDLERSYFDPAPMFDEMSGTYADLDAPTTHDACYEWQHPLSTVVSALIGAGLEIQFLHEYPFTLFPRWPFLERRDDGTFVLPPGMPQPPLIYSIRASKPPQ